MACQGGLATLKSCDTTKRSVCGWQYMLPQSFGKELMAATHGMQNSSYELSASVSDPKI